MAETEVEEGEARVDASIDPDTALSYIDKRLQRALGHFQKEFEGGISESLGPRYGGYGSFLPSYKLPSPVHYSHRKGPSPNKPSPLNSFRLEGAPAVLNPVTFADPVVQNVSSADNMASKDKRCIKKETPASNLVKKTEQRSLKVRIKVGLGLLTPSSSTGNNVEDSGGPPIESSDVSFNSPSGILGDMTSIFVPGNQLLSPLNESLVCLKIKAKPVVEKKTGFSVVEDVKAPVSEKGIKTESVDCKQGLTSDLKVKLSSDCTIPEAKRAAKKDVPLKKRETKNKPINDLSFGLENCEHKNIKRLSGDSIIFEPNRVAKKDVPLKKRETKKELLSGPDFIRKESDESSEKNDKKLSLDSRAIRQIACKNDRVVLKHEPEEVKISTHITKLPSERKSKLKDVQTGSMKNKISALKDIARVRNSYKDIFDTDNEAMEVANVGRNEIDAEVAVPQQTEVGPAAPLAEVAVPQQMEVGPTVPPDNWVGCDRCEKWRLLPIGIEPDILPDKWLCSMSTWLPGRNHCDISEDETTRAVQEMNLQLISQNQKSLQYNVSRGNIGNLDHTNRNVNSETMTNNVKKIKSKPEGSSSILIETNEPLVEKNGVVKAKRLKNKTMSDKHETRDNMVISAKMHTEDTPGSMKIESFDKKVEVPAKKRKLKDWQESQSQSQPYAHTLESREDGIKMKDKRLKTEVKESTDDASFNKRRTMKIKLSATKENSVDATHEKLLDKKAEIPAKKRKLKDWQESQSQCQSQSQPCANTLESSEDRIKMKDKRLKTGVKESTDDMSFIKGKTMKIKLSASKENSVDTSHGKSQQHREKITTSSSSKISGSSRRASLQERKGSPVGSVSSFSISAPNPHNNSPASGKTIPRKDIDGSRRSGGKVYVKDKEASKIMSTQGDRDPNGVKDNNQRSYSQRKMVTALTDSLTGQPNKTTKAEVDHQKHAGSEEKTGNMGSPEMNPSVKKELKKVKAGDTPNVKDPVEAKVEVQALDGSGQNKSKVMKHPGDAANQNAIKDLSVISFLKEYSSGQTALTSFRRAEESKDYADRLKISGFDYECNDAYFDSALKYLYASSLLETCTADIRKSKEVDPINGYTTSAKLSKICAEEYEKQKEYGAASLAYKCMEVAYMRIVYCKSLLTRQDLQTSMQIVTQGESPSSSVSDVDNLNNQAATMLSKNIAHQGNQLVVKNKANLMRLLDLTSDMSLAMEASTKSQNAYKAASAILEDSKNEMMILVKRVVDFSFQDVREIVCLVQNTREAINRQGFKGSNRR